MCSEVDFNKEPLLIFPLKALPSEKASIHLSTLPESPPCPLHIIALLSFGTVATKSTDPQEDGCIYPRMKFGGHLHSVQSTKRVICKEKGLDYRSESH